MNKANATFMIALVCSSFNCQSGYANGTKDLSGEKLPLFEQRRLESNKKDVFVDGHFSKSAWESGLVSKSTPDGKNYVDRSDEFRRFLQDYNLIGMSAEQVKDVLGTPDKQIPFLKLARYTIYGAPIDSGALLEIAYENGKVNKWRLYSIGHSGPWINTNALWLGHTPIVSADGKLQSYVPKKGTVVQE